MSQCKIVSSEDYDFIFGWLILTIAFDDTPTEGCNFCCTGKTESSDTEYLWDKRVVPIPVAENAANTTKNAGIWIVKYPSLCTNQTPYHII